ncbi:phage tail protein [Pararhodobacter sp.]|uniref:phage tail protein n=1 Tax=Pararhodobacter sp. TaxID=2127056 RepID=UPI002AFE23C7|nr:phage tail protein [Pararhodobacter sp.]
MPFIAPAIVGAVGLAGTTAGAVLGGLINVGIAGGLAYASSALSGKTGTTAQTGVQTDLRMGGGVARGGSYGRVGTAGFLAYSNSFADNNNMLDLVQVLGDGPHDGLDGVWVAGKRHAVTRIGGNAWRTDYRVEGVIGATGISYLTVVLWHGYSDQPASNVLVNYANPAGRWTAQDRLAGVCYAHVSGLYDEEAFPDGIPQCVFDLRGRRLYDWRKDSTVGGSGAHRWADERTWEFSENPILQLYNYQRGTWLGGELTVGMGVAPADLNLDAYTAAANACDELVAESDGSTAPRYRCGTYVAADEEHASVIQRFLDACGGALYESVGAYSPQAGVAQIVTYPTITDGDLVSGRPVRFAARRPRAELTNGVFGSFSDPKQQYELMAYAARTSAAAEAADGEIIRVQVDYPSVHHGLQAQRLAQMQLGLARLQATATITLGFSAVVLEPGDWVRWNSARYGLRTWMIASLTQHADQTVTLTLREIGAAAYAWSEADEGTVSAGGVPGDKPTLINTVPLMSVAATSLVGNDGNRQPALRITWAPILDATVDTIQIAYRIKGGTGAVLSASSASPNSGELLISAGVQGKTTYEVQGTITTTPKRTTVRTAWAEVTTGDLTVTPGAGVITVEMFEAGLREQVATEGRQAAAEFQAIADDMAMAIANIDAAAKLKADKVWEASKTEVERVGVRVGAAEASIEQERTVRAGETEALAQETLAIKAVAESANGKADSAAQNVATLTTQQTALADAMSSTGLRIDGIEAEVGDVAASVTVTSMTMAAPSGFTAAWQVGVKGTAGASVYGAWIMAVKGTGASATSWTRHCAGRPLQRHGTGSAHGCCSRSMPLRGVPIGMSTLSRRAPSPPGI